MVHHGSAVKEIVEGAQLIGRSFILERESVVAGRIDTVPRIAVPDRSVKAGGKESPGTDDAPRAVTNLVSVMHLFLRCRVAPQIFVTVF
jgi:hypothetical protein